MSDPELGELMLRHAPTAFHVRGGRDTFVEVNDRSDATVWMSTAPMTRREFKALDVSAPYTKAGIGEASMDAAAFRCSPDGAGGVPVKLREIGDIEFLCVARAQQVEPPASPGGPLKVSVDKHHTLAFRGHRDVRVLEVAGEHFVEVVGDDARDSELLLPAGGRLLTIHTAQPWIVDLPAPTTAWFWMTPGMRSFQGPVQLPEEMHDGA
jgi:hypothetical protein